MPDPKGPRIVVRSVGSTDRPNRPTAEQPARQKLRTLNTSRLARAGAYTVELGQDLAHLEAVAERLDVLRKPVQAVIARLNGAATTMALRSDLFARQLRQKLASSTEAVSFAQDQVLANQGRGPARDEADARRGIEQQIQVKTATAIATELTDTDKNAIEVAASTIEALRALEDAVARERLRGLGIGDNKDLTLEDLLRTQGTISDLETRAASELLAYYLDLQRLDPAEARRIESPLLQVAKRRADPVEGRKRARQVARPSGAENDRLDALKLCNLIEAARQTRVSPELATFEQEVRPQLTALVRKILGVDIKELSGADFEQFTKSWRPGSRLDEVAVRNAWPLRAALSQLPPAIKQQMPARFFGIVPKV